MNILNRTLYKKYFPATSVDIFKDIEDKDRSLLRRKILSFRDEMEKMDLKLNDYFDWSYIGSILLKLETKECLTSFELFLVNCILYRYRYFAPFYIFLNPYLPPNVVRKHFPEHLVKEWHKNR